MKKLKSIVATLAMTGLSYGLAHADQVVKIAVSGPLTGPQAVSGKDDENGLRMAIDELNRTPIKVDGQVVKFELLSEDDQADPKTGMQVAQRLIDQHPTAFLGPQNSGVAIPVSSLTSAAHIPMLTVASNPQLTKLGYNNIFRTGASDALLGSSMATFAVEKLHAKTAAVIDDRTAYGQGLADEFVAKAKSLGLEILDREYTTAQATDFLGILTTIKSKNPDVIFFGGYTPQGAPMAKQMRARAVRAKLLGGDGICADDLVKVAGPASANVYCSMSGAGLDGTPEGRAYIARYKEKFKTEPQAYGITYYDGMLLLANVISSAQTTDPEKLVQALHRANFKGVAATYTFDKVGDLINAPTTIFTFKDGQLVAFKQ
ncbi:branched-chain amino acid ABC transporter substrate-binding protein [Robbsia sp. KACC 23696]|uniref:branched-chain amino acid ABC transporter substrate-binding protein n=1 Tax=Robbsia sp. KACC 23696 TaxID=3149231 RepID=UPI00325B6F6E